MTVPLGDFRPRRSASAQEQIADHVRRLVLVGALAPDSRLPSTEELARRWHSNSATVHAALTTLVKEGLLQRLLKRGTFVRAPEKRLRQVAVYTAWPCDTTPQLSHVRHVIAAVAAHYRRQGVAVTILTDPRKVAEQSQPWPELLAAIRQRRLQAVIVAEAHRHCFPWLEKLPVVTAIMSSGGTRHRVSMDHRQFARDSVCALAEQGCRRIGVISTATREPGRTDPAAKGYAMLNETLRQTATDAGLEILPGCFIRPEAPIAPDDDERFGHEAFLRLWRQRRRPDGLVACFDFTARGVVLGVAQTGAQVPQKLKLVLHRNAGEPYYCPFTATFLETDHASVAAALTGMIAAQLRGEKVSPALVPYQLIAPPQEMQQ